MRTTLIGIILAGVIPLALPSFGQTFGEITGVVTNPSGAIVASATVTVTNPQTNFTRQAATNNAGNYAFPALLPGVYNVRAEMQGFQAEIRNGVELQVPCMQNARNPGSIFFSSTKRSLPRLVRTGVEDEAVRSLAVDLDLNHGSSADVCVFRFVEAAEALNEPDQIDSSNGESRLRHKGCRSEGDIAVASHRAEGYHCT